MIKIVDAHLNICSRNNNYADRALKKIICHICGSSTGSALFAKMKTIFMD